MKRIIASVVLGVALVASSAAVTTAPASATHGTSYVNGWKVVKKNAHNNRVQACRYRVGPEKRIHYRTNSVNATASAWGRVQARTRPDSSYSWHRGWASDWLFATQGHRTNGSHHRFAGHGQTQVRAQLKTHSGTTKWSAWQSWASLPAC